MPSACKISMISGLLARASTMALRMSMPGLVGVPAPLGNMIARGGSSSSQALNLSPFLSLYGFTKTVFLYFSGSKIARSIARPKTMAGVGGLRFLALYAW